VTERLLTAGEIAELLAVPESWVEREAREGRLPSVKLGHYRRYDRAAVLEWLEGQRVGQWRKHQPKAPSA